MNEIELIKQSPVQSHNLTRINQTSASETSISVGLVLHHINRFPKLSVILSSFAMKNYNTVYPRV